jgi:hypothetical protein
MNNNEQTQSDERKQIAATILEQLGGRMFAAMVGMRSAVALESGIRISFPAPTPKAPNVCTIELDRGSDTYIVSFHRMSISHKRGLVYQQIGETHDNAYAEDLQPIFTRATGLETSLGTLGR